MHNTGQYFLWIVLVILFIIVLAFYLTYWFQSNNSSLPNPCDQADPSIILVRSNKSSSSTQTNQSSQSTQTTQSNLCQQSQQLWDDHFYLTRLYIVSALRNSSGTAATAQRLLQNQQQLGKLYNSPKLGSLLTEHINQAVGLVNSTINNKGTPTAALVTQWSQNGRDIAGEITNLTGIPLSQTAAMMQSHLDLTAGELLAEYQCLSNPAACFTSVQKGDQALAQIREMSNHLCQGK